MRPDKHYVSKNDLQHYSCIVSRLMAVKPGQIKYFLTEISATSQKYENLYDNPFYRQMLLLNVPWWQINSELEKISDPDVRYQLRHLYRQYTADFITDHLSILDLSHQDDNSDFIYALYCIGLIHDPNYKIEDFKNAIAVQKEKIEEFCLKNDFPLNEMKEILQRQSVNPLAARRLRHLIHRCCAILTTHIHNTMLIRGDRHCFFLSESHVPQALLTVNTRAIPLSLSVIYLLLGRSIGLPVCGVNLPRHFIVKIEHPVSEIFLDPYNGGNLLDQKAIIQLLKSYNLPFQESYLRACTNEIIIRRMCANLSILFRQKNDRFWSRFLQEIGLTEG